MVAVIVMYFRIYTLTRVATSGLHEVYKSNGHSTQDPSQVTNMNGSIHGSSILLSPASIPCLIASTSPRLSQAVNSDNMVPQENHGIIQETTMNNLRKMRESTHRLILKASLIAAGFIITWTPATITRIMQLLGEPVPFSLFVCMGVCFASTGLLNSGVFLIMLLLKQGK
ncbi:hypothetical protein BC830DRAFT_445741 [Chytriomyces sp. MP71]|nr:hypothetical protein BC830DRAFT_445741 [Chytriomyces sp. MP71]